MKKIFTIIAAMMLSLTAAFAVELTVTQELDLTGFGAWEGGSYDAETKTLTPGKAWNGGNKWFGSYDASGYNQIVFELAEACSQPVVFNVYYADETYKQKKVIAAGETFGQIELNSTSIKDIHIALNSATFEGVTIKFDRLYLVGTRIKKTSLVTLNDTETEIANWDQGIGFGGDVFNAVHAGDQMIFNFTHKDGGEWDSQIGASYNNGKYLESLPGNVNLDNNDTQLRFTLTTNDVDSLRKYGLWVGGYYITISSIQLQKFAVIMDVENSFAADWSSGAFQVADADMPTLEDGDSLCVEVKTAVAGGQIMLQHTTDKEWTNFSPEFQHVFSAEDVAAMPKTIYLKFTTARITDLGSYKLCVNGNNFTLTKAYIIKGTPSADPTAIDEVSQSQCQCQKLIKNGQLFIIRDDKTYTIQGQRVH